MKKNKKNIKIFFSNFNFLVVIFFLSFLISGNVLADCSSGASCFQACPNNLSPTGGSCTITAADLSMPGVCCASITVPSTTATPTTGSPTSGGAYRNQEKIPGFGQTTDFPTYLKQIVNFGFAAIGIMAMFMLMIGAYQYLMAAGNIAKEESAKTTISSAFSGLILGLVAFLLLRTINPDLVAFNLSNVQGGPTGQSSAGPSGSTGGGGQGTGSGKCEPVQSGPCSEASLGSTCFGSNAYQASSICNAESGGGAGVSSRTDITADGRPFSVGLFQINLTVHDIGGLNCPSAFSGRNKNATVTNEGLYKQCVQAAQDPSTNIAKACTIGRNGSSWSAWGANSKCGF